MQVSLFNDVIGPVMRGPSSSHCAAALRIGRLARDLMNGTIHSVLVEFDRSGSLPTTHASQGSDMGLFGGLLGWDAADERLPHSDQALRAAGITLQIATIDVGDPHPNTYRLTLSNTDETHSLHAISTGGGMIEVLRIDDHPVTLYGDRPVTLRWPESGALEVLLDTTLPASPTTRPLAPVLPVLTHPGSSVPFTSGETMLAYDAGQQTPLWQLAVAYESARGGLTEADVLAKMHELVGIWRRSLAQGLAGTHYEDRLLGPQSLGFAQALAQGQLLDGGALNRMVLYVSALMEVKSAMGVIIAAPTAGACAALPGAVLGMAEALGSDDTQVAQAFLAAGLIGVFIATHWSFAAEVGGCQAEGGSAACMAAAALTQLGGGSQAQCLAAASMALQNMLGLICDPIANRVEAPCLGKNVMAASNALSCANLALAGYDPLIPLDEVIATAKRVSAQMPRELRCTALGGLSITTTSQKLEEQLRQLQLRREPKC